MISCRSSAWAMAWRTLRSSKGAFLLLVARIVSPSVEPTSTLNCGLPSNTARASGAKLLVPSTSPASSALVMVEVSEMKR
ncbi:hypothetical protein D3C87_2008010 [compost metagenome]